MNLGYAQSIYMLSCIVLSLIILLPTLTMVVPVSVGEQFSELWILGPNHMAEGYPFNVSSNTVYNVYLGVGNHMSKLGYYKIYAKFRNSTEHLPDITLGEPSSLGSIFEYTFFLRNNETWEQEFSFSFEGVSFEGNVSRISKILVGSNAVDINKMAAWNETSNSYYFQLFFELWIYNPAVSDFQFHNRWVGFGLNLT